MIISKSNETVTDAPHDEINYCKAAQFLPMGNSIGFQWFFVRAKFCNQVITRPTPSDSHLPKLFYLL